LAPSHLSRVNTTPVGARIDPVPSTRLLVTPFPSTLISPHCHSHGTACGDRRGPWLTLKACLCLIEESTKYISTIHVPTFFFIWWIFFDFVFFFLIFFPNFFYLKQLHIYGIKSSQLEFYSIFFFISTEFLPLYRLHSI
jgi:hypothetical protein